MDTGGNTWQIPLDICRDDWRYGRQTPSETPTSWVVDPQRCNDSSRPRLGQGEERLLQRLFAPVGETGLAALLAQGIFQSLVSG
jgi:hypothetical protein